MSKCYSETLWRIKDAEEMIKSRITDQEVRELVNSLDNRLTQEQELLKRHVAERRNRQT